MRRYTAWRPCQPSIQAKGGETFHLISNMLLFLSFNLMQQLLINNFNLPIFEQGPFKCRWRRDAALSLPDDSIA